MAHSLNILNWCALAPGMGVREQWLDWAKNCANHTAWQGDLPKSTHIPMMSARRMSTGSRLAVEAGLSLLGAETADMAIFTSRHGELERTYKILQCLQQQQSISPTDFAMSVHNTASGWLTITASDTLPVTSLAAGIDSFQQGILEAMGMLACGAERVLLVDFDGIMPDFYHSQTSPIGLPYALALLLTTGDDLQCEGISSTYSINSELPQGLNFLRNWLNKKSYFVIQGQQNDWQWSQ
ncbi:beta-ketoacyl synthase chain length factor [Yersinia enterocolitica]|uniref:Beta-ketoacyl synthase chain length factor n=1 Tax=Yersinia enterocolitica TaxID=630 RepID=A0AAD2V2S6_YEREN|nr:MULTISPECIES: beta-ketoacyl synthase chain length factor [Yersinia]EKN3339899.1 beta-ketoacyl synthase chain length factor [Yersinia enterocolitica]EKN3343320.1 beta-ketoacyl synthase chain length factor [Yersinia enterocolitica]EKN3384967.1 beta-ketoacyl synthase chain length factor [Yersinia enterocolitica]EKN3440232.1 beta-ketoacyl synthase chain length factor [Yersinia enterocolitica]EKN3505870.1 beta-ketoacyl synthase chain length factor [Yersinia enterocolitica]